MQVLDESISKLHALTYFFQDTLVGDRCFGTNQPWKRWRREKSFTPSELHMKCDNILANRMGHDLERFEIKSR